MAKLYAGQTKLRIRLTVNSDITGALVTLIKYKRPVSGTEGQWSATVESAATGIIYYDINATDIPSTEIGEWMFWAHITFSDGLIAPGEVVRKYFHEEPN